MKKIINFIVEKRYIVLSIMLALTLAMAFFVPMVKINFDMTLYLGSHSNMRKGLEILQENFPAASQSQSIRVMFKDLSNDQKQSVKKELENIVKYVGKDSDDPTNFGMVTHDNSENFNKDGYTLYMINTSAPYGSKEIKEIEKQLSQSFDGYDMCFVSDDPNYEIPTWIMILAISSVVIILILMCASWFEPLLFLLVIGLAIVTNFGSNIILGTISSVTASIAAILQLALSIDYSIILMNRYRQERKYIENKKEAMKKALSNSIISIFGSSLTTIVGLLALILMNFKIGADLGIVLAKGVFISLLYVITILPCLIIASDKLIFKSTKSTIYENMVAKRKAKLIAQGKKTKPAFPHKKPKNFASVMSNFTYRWRNIIMCVFIALFVALYFFQGTTPITFSLEQDDQIKQIFTPQNMVVLVYETDKENNASNVIYDISGGKEKSTVLNYHEIVEKEISAKEMAGNLSGFTSGITIPENIVKLFYYNKYDGTIKDAKAGDILNLVHRFVTTENSAIEIPEEMKSYIDIMKYLSSKEELNIKRTNDEMYEIFGKVLDEALKDENFINPPSFIKYINSQFVIDMIFGDVKNKISIKEFANTTVSLFYNTPYLKPELKEQLLAFNTIINAVDSDRDVSSTEMFEIVSKMSTSINKGYIDVLYLINSAEQNYNDSWKMSLEDLIAYVIEIKDVPPFNAFLNDEINSYLLSAQEMLKYAKSQLSNDKYSLMIINNTLPQEGKETIEFFDKVTLSCDKNFEKDHYYMVGMSYMNYEMHNNFRRELNIITIATVLVIFLVVALSFKNLIIPLILVCIVQCGVFLTVCSMHFSGVYFLALLIVECILMGATIDYGILFTNYYREHRKYTSIKKSIKNSYKHSIHTIMTSGLILILATGLIGVFDRSTISQICIAISLGALSAVLLILFVLPSLLMVFDKLVMGKNKKSKHKRRKNNKSDENDLKSGETALFEDDNSSEDDDENVACGDDLKDEKNENTELEGKILTEK